MATGDSVDDGRSKWCYICEDDGQQTAANHFCTVCDQQHCDRCKNFHSKMRTTKSHAVVKIDEIQRITSLTLDAESINLPFCKHHGKEIKFFCTKDMVEICDTCKLIDHKTCENLMDIDKAANELFSEDQGQKILESIKGLHDRFSLHQRVIKNDNSKLEEDKKSAIERIKASRRAVDSYLDKIENTAYEEIESVFKTSMKHLEDQMHACVVSVSSLQNQVSSLERAMSVGEKEQELIAINNVTRGNVIL